MKRPKKWLQPFVLVIHDSLLRARSLASVNPIVRFTCGGFAEVVSSWSRGLFQVGDRSGKRSAG
jgi:hypothetical protein